jgi:predicted nucleic acid-binding protein
MTEPTRGLLDTSVVIEGIRTPVRGSSSCWAIQSLALCRFADRLHAVANNLPLYTRNPDDFQALRAIVKVIAI